MRRGILLVFVVGAVSAPSASAQVPNLVPLAPSVPALPGETCRSEFNDLICTTEAGPVTCTRVDTWHMNGGGQTFSCAAAGAEAGHDYAYSGSLRSGDSRSESVFVRIGATYVECTLSERTPWDPYESQPTERTISCDSRVGA